MERLHPITEAAAISIVSAKATAFSGENPTPADMAVVPASWSTPQYGAMPQFDLNVWGAAALSITLFELLAGMLRSTTFVDDAVDTVDFANDELDVTSHIYGTGDGPFQLTTSGTLPTGLALATNYWMIYTNSGTVQLAASLADALAGTAVAFSDVGVGTHTIVDVVGGATPTKKMYWHSVGLLGHVQDGNVTLAARKAYTVRANHDPRTIAYALQGTLSASNASAEISAVQDQ